MNPDEAEVMRLLDELSKVTSASTATTTTTVIPKKVMVDFDKSDAGHTPVDWSEMRAMKMAKLAERVMREKYLQTGESDIEDWEQEIADWEREAKNGKHPSMTLEKLTFETARTFDEIGEQFERVGKALQAQSKRIDEQNKAIATLEGVEAELSAKLKIETELREALTKRLEALEERAKLQDTDWGTF